MRFTDWTNRHPQAFRNVVVVLVSLAYGSVATQLPLRWLPLLALAAIGTHGVGWLDAERYMRGAKHR